MHALNILSLNVNGLDSAAKRARVLEYLHRGSIFCALIQETYLICGTGLRHLLVGYLFVTLHSLPFDWTFGVLSMCLLFCFVCFEWMLCCDVVC